MLVIHPDECIDCGVCEPECPVDAIKDDNVPVESHPIRATAIRRYFNRQHPFVDVLLSDITDGGEVLDVSD